MPEKDEIARILAEAHREMEGTITRIVRLRGPREAEGNEPIKLLEVNPATSPSGIWPIAFSPAPPEVPYGSVIIEVTQAEFDEIIASRLPLPVDWAMAETLYPRGENLADVR